MNNQMKTLLLASTLTFVSTAAIAGGPPAKEGESKRSYEMNMFDEKASAQGPGIQLAVPGDMVRYTYVIDDEFINDPAYKLSRAIIGVHIIDADMVGKDKDEVSEWGSVHLDGAPRTTRDDETTDHIEIRSDEETENKLPPYIYNIPELITDDGMLVLEVTNLNKDGGKDMSAEYGDFNMMRAGLHLFYTKVK